MDEILKQVVAELQLLRQDMSLVIQDVATIKNGMNEVGTDLRGVKELAQATFDQVGLLTEFRTETGTRLRRIEQILSEQSCIVDRLAARSLAQESDIIAIKRAK